MNTPIAIIDAFANAPFTGNPAAVCMLEQDPEEQWMSKVAAEMNLSETAFLAVREDGSYSLRWFTPVTEVDLCGHATLAAAHYLWEQGLTQAGVAIAFHTRSGLLIAEQTEKGITLHFPAVPVAAAVAPELLIQGLGLIPRYVGRNAMDYLIEVDSEETVRTLRPDFALLSQVETRGIIVTARANPGAKYEIVSRAFFPNIGVNEDPVTGSAHCALAPYWHRRLRKDEWLACQASARGGELYIGIEEGGRVAISGQAVTVMTGRLHR